MSLTDTFLRNLKPGEKAQKFTDGEGLYLYMSPSGSKLWRLDYRYGGKRKTISFGAYPAISLKDARKLRMEAKEQIAKGSDPAELKKNAKAEIEIQQKEAANTFEAVGREWFQKKSRSWSPRYSQSILFRLENHLFPYIGKRPINELKPADYLDALKQTEQREAFYMAHRLAQLCGQISRYARIVGLTEYDTAAGLTEVLTPAQCGHFSAITDPEQFAGLLKDIDNYSGEPAVCYALRIMPYVFTISSELRGADWSEINLEKAEWIIPAERMKKRRPHTVPLATQVVALFKSMQIISGNEGLVFPSLYSKTKCISDVGLLNALRRMGYGKDVMTVHGFRSVASTLLNEQGYRSELIEAQLAHVETNKVRAAYNRAEYIEERRIMMQEWADYLDSLKAE